MVIEGRAILWTPVLIAFGIGFYFHLESEPAISTGLIVAAACLTLFVAGVFVRINWARYLLIGLACVCAGFASAKFRTLTAGTPVLEYRIKDVHLEGRVLDVESERRGWRTIIQTSVIDGLNADKRPVKVRLTWPSDLEVPRIGTQVTVSTHLWPPPKPVTPGGFDFGRKVFFLGIGAFGRVNAIIEVREGDGDWRSHLQDFRRRAATNVSTLIGGQEGAVAAALVTGDRSRLSAQTKSDLRAAGLAHLLAISGLHMGLAVGVVFFGVRAAMALVPRLVLRYPIKKWAALFALISGAGYLAISGASVSTVRAFIMAAIALSAIMIDRQAISLRTVAIAAVVILLFQPEVLVEAGFQMSFAAVVALVSVYEMLGRWAAKAGRAGWGERGMVEKAGASIFGTGMTTLIASLATAPFAAAHFNRIAAFALLGNLAAMPVMALLIMPAAVIACALSPLGIAQPAWILMGMGIGFVLDIAHWIAALPGADTMIASPPAWVLPVISLGGLTMAIQRQHLARIVGGGLILAGLSGFTVPDRPDILAGRWGQTVAIRGPDGHLHVVGTRPRSFDAKQWLRRDGRALTRDPDQSNMCNAQGECSLPDDLGLLQIAGKEADIKRHCSTARIVIASVRTPLACPQSLLLDPGDFGRHGNVTIDPHSLDMETVDNMRGNRPWVSSRYRD